MLRNVASFGRALIVGLVAASSSTADAVERSLPDLITIDSAPRQAELVSVSAAGELQFRDASERPLSLKASELVRWSTPAAPRAADKIVLADGSRLDLAPSWGKEPAVSFDGEKIVARTAQFGRLGCDRSGVRAIGWRLPADEGRQTQLWDELWTMAEGRDGADHLVLDNGDSLTGTLRRIGQHETPSSDEASPIVVTFDASIGMVELPVERVRGLYLSTRARDQPLTDLAHAPLLVGLSDGGRIAADAIRSAGDGKLVVVNPVLGALSLRHAEDVISLQSFGTHVTYLSDVKPISYRHEPYLDLAWPYRRDRNALGAPLQVGGRSYPIGLGMHSAARLTFKLDGGYDRFAATVAIDDAAKGGGSVVFRVFLRSGDAWQEAYASGIVRGGDLPTNVAVDLAGASQLALAVDYADRGDERDYANWLDARLERSE